MKVITIFALAVWAASPATAAPLAKPGARVTSKPVEEFVGCFVAGQRRASLPWWFVPKDHGGTISNMGANDGRPAYFSRSWTSVRDVRSPWQWRAQRRR